MHGVWDSDKRVILDFAAFSVIEILKSTIARNRGNTMSWSEPQEIGWSRRCSFILGKGHGRATMRAIDHFRKCDLWTQVTSGSEIEINFGAISYVRSNTLTTFSRCNRELASTSTKPYRAADIVALRTSCYLFTLKGLSRVARDWLVRVIERQPPLRCWIAK